MSVKKTEAIVLAVRNWAEADRIVTVFSKEYGKIEVMAYGARRPRSAVAAGLQPFSQVELTLSAGRRMDTVRLCSSLRCFRELREHLARMAYASFLAEVCDVLSPDGQADEYVYERLLALLRMMTERNPRLTALAGALQLMEHGGYGPITGRCAVCGAERGTAAWFDGELGGAVCADCRRDKSVELRETTRGFLAWLEQLGGGEETAYRVTGRDLMDVEKLLLTYLTDIADHSFHSLRFLTQMNGKTI